MCKVSGCTEESFLDLGMINTLDTASQERTLVASVTVCVWISRFADADAGQERPPSHSLVYLVDSATAGYETLCTS